MSGRRFFALFKPIISVLVFLFRILPRFLCVFVWHLIMPFNGVFSKLIRYCILKAKASKVGNNLSVGANTIIKHWGNFSCGDNVSIHEFCMIDCDGKVSIGNNVSIAHATSFVSANHTWEDNSLPIKYNPLIKLGITIKDDVWIGCGVRILDGILIERRSIVAAGAVVNKNVGQNSLVGGVPAKVIKKI